MNKEKVLYNLHTCTCHRCLRIVPTIFVGKIKQLMFHWLWKFKSNTLINNHFIIKYFMYMVWSPCYSPFSSVIFHNVIVFIL